MDFFSWRQNWGDGKKLAVVGNSAGGNLAAAVALMAKDKKGPIFCIRFYYGLSPILIFLESHIKNTDKIGF
ncbi:alpha/beta hydrolase [Chryseobacterium sp. B21-037]|uniref:alpha/beta hydrolase fold domain-containing protein n=1 Tax=Chryseobacterium sp. B21-037 TaxID=2926038 RepID=UPI002358E872|nr:alpha/beta hydrolase fold domain-containing protein [Chryseobacterium sp. B21-037]MDC8102911.1 alpha/beta hydrolase [Chryseobacterium sp. B21-037]